MAFSISLTLIETWRISIIDTAIAAEKHCCMAMFHQVTVFLINQNSASLLHLVVIEREDHMKRYRNT